MPTRYEGKKSEGSHKMKDGSVMSGKTHTKDSKVVKKAPSKKPKMAEADIDGEKIKFKEGALHKQLKSRARKNEKGGKRRYARIFGKKDKNDPAP